MSDLKSLIGRLNFLGGQRSLMGTARRFTLGAAKAARGPTEALQNQIKGISEIAAFVEAEASSWVEPEDFAQGRGGPFDACDLRHWLVLAERAGVPAIEARPILTLTEAEISAISQKIQIPDSAARTIRNGLAKAFPEASLPSETPEDRIDPGAVYERLFTAMDDVPWDWMVRSNISGSSMLKALAGSGVIGNGNEGSRLSDDVEVGAGWVSHGNRRRVDATDNRFIETFVRGHKGEIHFLARPWVEASRRITGEDPHRHGSPFAGKGEWPAEWRVFVTNGQVTGVGSYYGWIGEVTAENAHHALEAARLAQKIVDEAVRIGAATRLMDMEILRNGPGKEKQENNAVMREMLEVHPADGVSCTLDFLETKDGLVLLEGGPAHTLIGGAHPVAFAGHGLRPEISPGYCDCSGVALALAPGVCLGDLKTWRNADTRETVLSWTDAERLAAGYHRENAPSP